jgi:hypothetical protein
MTDEESEEPSASAGVGYRNPPKSRQFVKGKSGNPAGRPKSAKTTPPGSAPGATLMRCYLRS